MADYGDEDDHVTVDTDGESVNAGGGDDTVIVYANGVVVHGDEGDDWLATNLSMEAAGEDTDGDGIADSGVVDEATADLNGDEGDDLIHASLRMVNSDPYSRSATIVAKLHGGDGNDQLWLDLDADGTGFDVTMEGGIGADDIRVTARGHGDYYGASGPVVVDAGSGDDTVRVSATGRAEWGDVTVRAGNGNDFVESYSSNIGVEGYASGTNYLFGGNGNDTLIGSAPDNEAEGGSGADQITLSGMHNTANGGTGNDLIAGNFGLGISVFDGPEFGQSILSGGGGNDTVTASAVFYYEGEATNEVHGGEGADELTAVASFDLDLDSVEPGYELRYFTAHNLVYGDAGDDRLTGVIEGAGEIGEDMDLHSELYGGEGADYLSVRGGEGNILTGNQGDDTLVGSAGADRLVGGQDDDLLRGRGGEDVFAFGSIRNGERDRIGDFAIGEDLIDLAYIDANVFRAGNQSFVFGTREGTGRVWVETEEQRSVVYADNGRSILEIALLDGRGVEASDYSAGDFLL